VTLGPCQYNFHGNHVLTLSSGQESFKNNLVTKINVRVEGPAGKDLLRERDPHPYFSTNLHNIICDGKFSVVIYHNFFLMH
jgi:hypothetical protein